MKKKVILAVVAGIVGLFLLFQLHVIPYYINSTGQFVHTPTYSGSIPVGASAKCRDGSYSFSLQRRGTCSYHEGVAEWY